MVVLYCSILHTKCSIHAGFESSVENRNAEECYQRHENQSPPGPRAGTGFTKKAAPVVGDWGYKNKGLFPPKPSRRDVMVLMFGTQSVTFWYPTSSQFRTRVRPPNPYLPLSLTLKGRDRGEGARAPPRPSHLTRDDLACPSHVLPTDRQTPSAGRVAPIPRWKARAIKSSKTIGEGVSDTALNDVLVHALVCRIRKK